MSLTKRQRRFVEAYLLEPNGKKAAIAAGYSPATAMVQASRLLRHAQVAAELAKAQKLLSVRTGITPEMVVAELAKIGFADIRKAVEWRSNVTEVGEDPDTGEPQLRAFNEVRLIDSSDLDEATAGAIAEVSQTKDGALKVKLHDKRAALVDIGKHLGMFKPTGKSAEDGDDDAAVAPGAKKPAPDAWDGLLN